MNLIWKASDGQPLTGLTHMAGVDETAGEQIQIAGITLDTFLNSLTDTPRIRFVKVDVEGAELAVLQGALVLIRKQRPIFFLEINHQFCLRYDYQPKDIFDFMHSHEYQGFVIHFEQRLPVQADTYSGSGDVLFMPKELLEVEKA